VNIMDPNFGLVSQGKIASCPGDMCNRDEIPEGCFSILIHKVWVQDVKLQYSQPGRDSPQVRMKDAKYAPILWRKTNLNLLSEVAKFL
jgi:hypothetical protein